MFIKIQGASEVDAILAVVAVDPSATSATGEREKEAWSFSFAEEEEIHNFIMSGLVKRERERKMEREPCGSERERDKLFSFWERLQVLYLSGLVTLPENAERRRTVATSATVWLHHGFLHPVRGRLIRYAVKKRENLTFFIFRHWAHCAELQPGWGHLLQLQWGGACFTSSLTVLRLEHLTQAID